MTELYSKKQSEVQLIKDVYTRQGLTVVAEGVETKEQAEHLNGLDCEIMQGYYFAKPVPISEFEQLAYGTLEKT